MREGLWEVAQLAFEVNVVFLREEPYIVTNCEQSLEHFNGFAAPPEQCQVINVPKRTGQERGLIHRHSFHMFANGAPLDKAIFHQTFPDCIGSANDERI